MFDVYRDIFQVCLSLSYKHHYERVFDEESDAVVSEQRRQVIIKFQEECANFVQ